MLTREANERLTMVGPGTPMGNLLRRYWHPIAAATELEQEPVLPVRLLGENIVLYRNERGDMGLVAEEVSASRRLACLRHSGRRRAALPISRLEVQQRGPLPGAAGRAGVQHLSQPHSHPGLRVQELGGLIWAYLGPQPAPLLPRIRPPCPGGLRPRDRRDAPALQLVAGYGELPRPRALGVSARPSMPTTFNAGTENHPRRPCDTMSVSASTCSNTASSSAGCSRAIPSRPMVGRSAIRFCSPTFLRWATISSRISSCACRWTTPIHCTSSISRKSGRRDSAPGTDSVCEIEWKHPGGRLTVESVIGQDMMAWGNAGRNFGPNDGAARHNGQGRNPLP